MTRREQLLYPIRTVLVRPTCRRTSTELTCGFVARRDDALRFTGLSEAPNATWLNAVKAAAKHWMGRLYALATSALTSAYQNSGAEVLFGADALARSDDDRVVCVDGYGYRSVHVLCDLAALPFADGSTAGVLSEAVLGRVSDPGAFDASQPGSASSR